MNNYKNTDTVEFLDQIEDGSLYHYTSASGVIGIIDNECFWVSKSNFLNDSSEINYINELIVDVTNEMRLPNSIVNMIMKEKAYIESSGDEHLQNYYILSLTDNPDSLTLWSGYSNFYGYNIGFDGRVLRETLDKVPLSVDGKVIYNRERQISLIKYEIEKYTVEINEFIREENSENQDKLIIGINNIGLSLALLGMFLKDPCFSHEEEYRVVFFQYEIDHEDAKNNHKVYFRVSNGIITPYIEIKHINDSNKLPILSVTIGPKNNIDIAQDGLEFYLTKRGYDSIPVIRSSIPLRY